MNVGGGRQRAGDVGDFGGGRDFVVGDEAEYLAVRDALRGEIALELENSAIGAHQAQRGKLGARCHAEQTEQCRELGSDGLVGRHDDLGSSGGGDDRDACVGDHGLPSSMPSWGAVVAGLTVEYIVVCEAGVVVTTFWPGAVPIPRRKESRCVLTKE